MHIVRKQISIEELQEMADKGFGGLVKAVVDIDREVMGVDAELHADEEMLLLEDGSQQEHLWGINLYPDKYGEIHWIEFDSMINLRPSWGNTSRGVDDPKIQEVIRTVVQKLVTK